MTAYSAAVFKQLLPASRPIEVGAGVDVQEFSAPGISGARFREKYGLGQGPLVLYVGRKERVKRYDLAVAAIAASAAGARLVMVGEDVDQLPIVSANVRVLGKLPRAEVLDAYDACQVVLFPSESESFRLVILEAWMRRRPVIGNRHCGAVAALIEHGTDGFLCADSRDMAARLDALLADPHLCARLGE